MLRAPVLASSSSSSSPAASPGLAACCCSLKPLEMARLKSPRASSKSLLDRASERPVADDSDSALLWSGMSAGSAAGMTGMTAAMMACGCVIAPVFIGFVD